MYKVEIFFWENGILKTKVLMKATGREAFDYAYSQKWDVLKIYDIDGDLMHINYSKKDMETYA